MLKSHQWEERVESLELRPTFRSGRLIKQLLERCGRIYKVAVSWRHFDSKPLDLTILEQGLGALKSLSFATSVTHQVILTLLCGTAITHLELNLLSSAQEDIFMLPSLRHLHLISCRLLPISQLWWFPQLEELWLINVHFDRQTTLFRLPRLTRLTIIDLSSFSIFPQPASLPSLQDVSIFTLVLHDFDEVSAVARFVHLVSPTLVSFKLDVTLFRSNAPHEQRASAILYAALYSCLRLTSLWLPAALLDSDAFLPSTVTRLRVMEAKATDRIPSTLAVRVMSTLRKSIGLEAVVLPLSLRLIQSELEKVCDEKKISLTWQ